MKLWVFILGVLAVSSASVSGSDTNVIGVNSEYWMQAPNATNGSPAGVLQSYAPLVYPHPRVTADDGVTVIFQALQLNAGSVRAP